MMAFMSTPFVYIALEVHQKLFKRGEAVVFLSLAQMPVVNLAAFVVVPNPAYTRSTVVEPVLVAVRRWCQGSESSQIICFGYENGRHVFFFQAEDGIRDHCVTGVQTCALPI